MSELPDRERIWIADESIGKWGTDEYQADWSIRGRFTEDEADAIVDAAYSCAAQRAELETVREERNEFAKRCLAYHEDFRIMNASIVEKNTELDALKAGLRELDAWAWYVPIMTLRRKLRELRLLEGDDNG